MRFAKPIASPMMDKFSEMEKQMKDLKWKKQKMLDDINRENVLRKDAMEKFGKKKEVFVRFLAMSSATNQVTIRLVLMSRLTLLS